MTAVPDPARPPVLSVVRGSPTAEEIAAVVAVLAALAAPASAPPVPPVVRSEWSARSRLIRGPVLPGPGGWRASALPR